MSEIKFKSSIESALKDINLIPEEFFVITDGGRYRVLWLLDRQKPSVEADYSFDMERYGVTREGKIIWGFDSGCSCPSPWSSSEFGDDRYSVGEWKEFEINPESGFDADWQDACDSNLKDYLKLIEAQKDNLEPREVLQIANSEIRRYLIKRIGYDRIKKEVKAEVIHKDGNSELLLIENNGSKEKYVKVKDHSTEREYLLYVPDNIQRCREGIAWTFGLTENEYAPIVES